MAGMAQFPDNFFDLAIVDPPYSDKCNLKGGSSRNGTHGWKTFSDKIDEWNVRPDSNYFKELIRTSKNQIICGGNYFAKDLIESQGWIFWDKGQREFSLADGELIYTSFDRALRVFNYSRSKSNFSDEKFHPNQKPVALYRWLLQHYAKPGDTIIDTHVGSASSLIACEWEGFFDYVGFELDKDYYHDAKDRLETWRERHFGQYKLALAV